MQQSVRARVARALATSVFLLAAILPAGMPALAADEPLVLRTGTDQELLVLNPFNSVTVADFEVFTLNYDLLVNFGQDLAPVPGFAESWTRSDDGMSYEFTIRSGMKWSDGEPATSEDARWTIQLMLDAVAKNDESVDGYYLGQGGMEGYMSGAGVTAVSAPDPATLVVELDAPTTLIETQPYFPILPKHIWSEYSMDEIANAAGATPFLNEPPIVGTGPYQAIEWQPNEFIRFARNPNYWGRQGAADEVIIQHFGSGDTMVQALKTGAVDYVRGVLADQFEDLQDEPNIETVEGFANGYSELSFNTGGTKEGYNGSTAALSDPAFRDALGYAVDQQALVEATLGGYGEPGSTIIPPYHSRWHVQPDNPRTFDLEEAASRLVAAGYELDAQGRRLDQQGQPINLRLTWPDSEGENATNAQFLVEWFGELGIGVDAAVQEEAKVTEIVTGPPNGPADYDIYMWGWVGDPDPTSLLYFLTTDEIGGYNDSFYSNERFDELYELQRVETDEDQRHEYLAEMQNLAYDEAPYIILYYDSELHAYRTDKFGGWTGQPPDGGTPLFGYGSIGYSNLTDINAQPSEEPSSAAPSGGATPRPSGDGAPAGGSGDNLPLILGAVALVVIIAVGLVLVRRRGAAAEEE